MKYSVLANRNNFKEVILEEKYNFINGIAEELGIDLGEVLTSANPDVFERRKLKDFLSKLNIYISFEGDDSVKIYFRNDGNMNLIATWAKPHYILVKDPSELDLEKKVFFKIFFEFNSIFDEENQDV